MATYSELMGLILPEETDPFSIDHFNQNFNKIDGKMDEVSALATSNKIELLASLDRKIATVNDSISAHQAQLDALRYNDYLQLMKLKHLGNNISAKGFWIDIFTDSSLTDTTQTSDGFRMGNSKLIMWQTTETFQLGITNNQPLQINHSGEAAAGLILSIPRDKCVRGGLIKWVFTAYSPGTANIEYGCGSFGYQQITLTTSPKVITYEAYVKMDPTKDYILYAGSSINTERQTYAYDSSRQGDLPMRINNTTTSGSLVGTLTMQCKNLPSDIYYAKKQSTPAAFTKVTMYCRQLLHGGESITPEIALNGTNQWRSLGSPIITPTTNHVSSPCNEYRYVLAGLPSSTQFQMRFRFSRSGSLIQSPELYDYTLIYD